MWLEAIFEIEQLGVVAKVNQHQFSPQPETYIP